MPPTDGTNIVNKTSRLKPGLYSADINKDGIVEIPVVEEEITTVDSGRRLSFVSWRDLPEIAIVWCSLGFWIWNMVFSFVCLWHGRTKSLFLMGQLQEAGKCAAPLVMNGM